MDFTLRVKPFQHIKALQALYLAASYVVGQFSVPQWSQVSACPQLREDRFAKLRNGEQPSATTRLWRERFLLWRNALIAHYPADGALLLQADIHVAYPQN